MFIKVERGWVGGKACKSILERKKAILIILFTSYELKKAEKNI